MQMILERIYANSGLSFCQYKQNRNAHFQICPNPGSDWLECTGKADRIAS